MYMQVYVNVLACFHAGQRLIDVDVFLNHSLLKGLRQGFSLTQGLTSPARLLCGEDQGFSCLPFPSTGIAGTYHDAAISTATSDSYSLRPLTSL